MEPELPPPVEDNGWDEEEEELLRNIGEHSLLSRVQKQLYDQLSRKKYRLEVELREISEDADRARKQREDLGVELYGMQQQLARLQSQLETTHNNSHLIGDIRKKSELDLERLREVFKERQAQVEAEESKLEHAKAEVEGINETIRQAEAYDKQMKSEIAVTRRETYAAEEAVSKLEKAKQVQDVFIDKMSEEYKTKSEELALYEARLASQRQEAAAAAATLSEAVKEMEVIQTEKKQLLMQWQSTLIAVQKRNEALQTAHDALRKLQEEELALQAEDTGVRKEISACQNQHSALQERADKADSETTFLQTQLAGIRRSRDALAERYSMLQRSFTQTESEMNRLRLEQEELQKQLAQLEQDRQTVDRERQELEAGYAANISSQATVHKAAKNLVKERKKVMEKIHAKEAEKLSVENELARLKIDAMNVESHNMQLEQTLAGCLRDLKDKDQLIEKYSMEIRQRNDAIEKKMSVVDRLNRKYEKLTAGVEEENLGPLEATINNLTKQIAAKTEASDALQRQWLQDQTMLVEAANNLEMKTEKAHDMKSQQTLNSQKQLRLEASIAQQQTEIAGLRKAVSAMHGDVVRLNALIAQNETMSKKLAEANFSLEKEFVVELKELESESVQMEARVAALKEEKAKLLEDILEAERQVLLWEKKIQLEKETQAALDPSVGMAEAAEMEREIHRMKLRAEALKRTQEKLLKDMELAIDKREMISIKVKAKSATAPVSAAVPATQASLKKQIAQLKSSLKAATVDAQGYDEALQLKRQELEALEMDLESESKTLNAYEAEAATLQHGINATLYEKQRALEKLASVQRTLSRYEAMSRGRRPKLTPEEADSVYELEREALEEQARIRAVIDGLVEAHPGMSEVLHRVSQLLEV